MDKLQVSQTGDCHSADRQLGFWLDIHFRGKCPQCRAIDSMLQGPRGGLAMYLKCKVCHMVFWTTPFPVLGTWPFRDDTPTQKQLQAHPTLSSEDHLLLDNNKEDQP